MKYTFDIVGVSPILQFFNHQQQSLENPQSHGVEYLGTHKCTLDAFLATVEQEHSKCGWNMDEVVDTEIQFWMNNSESIGYWKSRLTDAGDDNLLVGRVADIKALKSEFNSLLGEG